MACFAPVGLCSGGLESHSTEGNGKLGRIALALAVLQANAITGQTAATNMCIPFTRDDDHVCAAWHQDVGCKKRSILHFWQSVAGTVTLQLPSLPYSRCTGRRVYFFWSVNCKLSCALQLPASTFC